MHGQLVTLRCESSGRSEHRMEPSDLEDAFLTCSCCATPQRLRPDIVWFGETPLHMDTIYARWMHAMCSSSSEAQATFTLRRIWCASLEQTERTRCW